MSDDDETFGHKGCTKIGPAVRCCICGDYATRIEKPLCEACWAMWPHWKAAFDKSPDYAKKREWYLPG